MSEYLFEIRFEGRGASSHTLEMRQMGYALIGFERIVTQGLFALENGKLPGPRQSLKFTLHAGQIHDGSLEIPVWIKKVSSSLKRPVARIAWHWSCAVLKKERKNESDEHISKALDLARKSLDVVGDKDKIIMKLLESPRFAIAADKAVRPVGHDCDSIVLNSREGREILDLPRARAIRRRRKVRNRGYIPYEREFEVLPPEPIVDRFETETMKIAIDGFSIQKRELYILDSDDPEIVLTALVEDPVFYRAPNIYTKTAADGSSMNVVAKIRRINGVIQDISILEALKKQKKKT